MLTQAAMFCLALNIYHEARGEPLLGQIAVGTVTMNRSDWNTAEICSVVYAPKQFSWTHLKGDPFKFPPPEDVSWIKSKVLAAKIIRGIYKDVTNGATHYHTSQVRPEWRKRLKRTTVIGNHIFYTEK